jgi:hypothetical protein
MKQLKLIFPAALLFFSFTALAQAEKPVPPPPPPPELLLPSPPDLKVVKKLNHKHLQKSLEATKEENVKESLAPPPPPPAPPSLPEEK